MSKKLTRRSVMSVLTALSSTLLTGFEKNSHANTKANLRSLSQVKKADISGTIYYDNSVWTPIPGDFSNIADDKNVVLSYAQKKTAWFRDFDGRMKARWFGVRADGLADDTASLQAGINATSAVPGSNLELPGGEMLLKGSILIPAQAPKKALQDQFMMRGIGAGRNGSFLHFLAGTLIVRASNHALFDLHITSDDGDGISIEPSVSPANTYPTRSIMQNVRAEGCKGSGITITNCWIYTMINVFARRNRNWGLEGKAGRIQRLACNSLNIIGGEFQGNGKKVGAAEKSERGLGGGIFTGRVVQFSMTNSVIEGNIGDGLVLDEQVRGLTLLGCYFEKNGSHHLNIDIGNAPPSHYNLGPNSGFILNCNFTPQNENGKAQERAIDLIDFTDLKIVNPQFFAQSGPVLYSKPPIRVKESLEGRSTGWVEGGVLLSSEYKQDMIENLCDIFGRPITICFSPDIDLPANIDSETRRFVITLPGTAGKRIEVSAVARPVSSAGKVRLRTIYRRGPAGIRISEKENILTFSDAFEVGRVSSYTSPITWGGHTEISIARMGKDKADDLKDNIKLLALEITTYEAHISA